LPFPFTISGELTLPLSDGEAAATACDGIVEALERQGASTSLYYLPDISLRVPVFRGFRWNWDFAAPLDRIDLKLEEGAQGTVLRYRLSLIRLVAMVTLSVVTLPFLARDVASQFPDWVWFAMWGWPVIGSYAVTSLRAKRFFRRAMLVPPRVTTPAPDPMRERARTTGFPPINWP
jgi:hypothetical protein